MFTGIITSDARFVERAKNRLSITLAREEKDLVVGESIAINGVCLTLTRRSGTTLFFDVLQETLEKTNLGRLEKGSMINYERALRADARLGGHFVTGHIDGTGIVAAFEKNGQDWQLDVRADSAITQYIIPKGSVAIDGVSLTVVAVSRAMVSARIIPHTFAHTSLRSLKKNDAVNIEVDILTKSVYTFLNKKKASSVDRAFLTRHGFL